MYILSFMDKFYFANILTIKERKRKMYDFNENLNHSDILPLGFESGEYQWRSKLPRNDNKELKINIIAD